MENNIEMTVDKLTEQTIENISMFPEEEEYWEYLFSMAESYMKNEME